MRVRFFRFVASLALSQATFLLLASVGHADGNIRCLGEHDGHRVVVVLDSNADNEILNRFTLIDNGVVTRYFLRLQGASPDFYKIVDEFGQPAGQGQQTALFVYSRTWVHITDFWPNQNHIVDLRCNRSFSR